MNDQSGLLWREGSRTFFWGGGGGQLQFKVAVSEDSGATWNMHLPHLLNKIAPTELATQPITTAFRGKDGGLFMGVDSAGASSGLWKSLDNGTSWADTHGRTVGRHTTFFTAEGREKIMAFGGKNSDIDGYMPYTFSTDSGASFAKGAKLPFPALGGNQRPCVHRLLSGNLVFVGDLQQKGSGKQPANFSPKVGETSGVYAALSTDDGESTALFLSHSFSHTNLKSPCAEQATLGRSSLCRSACHTKPTSRTSGRLATALCDRDRTASFTSFRR